MNFLDGFENFHKLIGVHNLPVEGIVLMDENEIIREYHYLTDKPRNIYSHTKSYLSLAIGVAIDLGLMTLEDRLTEYFDFDIEDDNNLINQIKLSDLLTMSSGFGEPLLMGTDRRSGIGTENYISYLMSKKVKETPGSRFVYSSADSILAMKMLEKAVREPVGLFFYKHVFSVLEQGWPIWEHDTMGTPVGCGGIHLTLSNMSKLGQVYLNNGLYRKKRIVSESWVNQSSTKRIDTLDKSDIWHCGYGYQFWMCPYEGSFRADGKYGQLTVVFPKQGFVFGIQCPENGDFESVKRFLHEDFFAQI